MLFSFNERKESGRERRKEKKEKKENKQEPGSVFSLVPLKFHAELLRWHVRAMARVSGFTILIKPHFFGKFTYLVFRIPTQIILQFSKPTAL